MTSSYWDTHYDEELLKNPIGTKLIYTQFLDDHNRYWVQPNEQQSVPLKRLIEQNKQQEVSIFRFVVALYFSILGNLVGYKNGPSDSVLWRGPFFTVFDGFSVPSDACLNIRLKQRTNILLP